MKIIENFNISGKEKAIVESGHDHLIIRNGVIEMLELDPASTSGLVGMDIRGCQLVEIINVTVKAVNLKRKYAYGLRSGYSGDVNSYNKKVLIDHCSFTGLGPLNPGYDLNRDCIASEGGDDLWIKDTIFDGASDAAIDCKTKNLKAARCQLNSTYRLIRAWAGNTTMIDDCVFNTTAEHLWHYSNAAKTILYKPTFVQPMKTSYDQSPGVIQHVSVNPLTDPWFAQTVTPIDRLIALQTEKVALEQKFLKLFQDMK